MADIETPVEGEENDVRADLMAAIKEHNTQDAAPEPEAPEPQETEPSEKPERARDEHGRFAKVEKAEEPKPAEVAPKQAPETQQATPVDAVKAPETPAPAPPSGPPPGWSVAAKAEFDKLPKAVQEAVVRREEEVNRGFQKLQDYKGLDRYVEVARNSGTTLDQALDRYMAAENLLAQNFTQGVLGLCQNYRIHPQQLIAELSGMFGGQSTPPEAPQSAPYMAPVLTKLQELDQWRQTFLQQQQEAEAQAINSQLQEFAANPANRYFENVRQDMAALINAGKATNLADAYEQACWLNPEIRALRIKDEADKKLAEQQAAVNQARKASASLPTGSPTNASSLGIQSNSLRDQIRAAIAESRSTI